MVVAKGEEGAENDKANEEFRSVEIVATKVERQQLKDMPEMVANVQVPELDMTATPALDATGTAFSGTANKLSGKFAGICSGDGLGTIIAKVLDKEDRAAALGGSVSSESATGADDMPDKVAFNSASGSGKNVKYFTELHVDESVGSPGNDGAKKAFDNALNIVNVGFNKKIAEATEASFAEHEGSYKPMRYENKASSMYKEDKPLFAISDEGTIRNVTTGENGDISYGVPQVIIMPNVKGTVKDNDSLNETLKSNLSSVVEDINRNDSPMTLREVVEYTYKDIQPDPKIAALEEKFGSREDILGANGVHLKDVKGNTLGRSQQSAYKKAVDEYELATTALERFDAHIVEGKVALVAQSIENLGLTEEQAAAIKADVASGVLAYDSAAITDRVAEDMKTNAKDLISAENQNMSYGEQKLMSDLVTEAMQDGLFTKGELTTLKDLSNVMQKSGTDVRELADLERPSLDTPNLKNNIEKSLNNENDGRY